MQHCLREDDDTRGKNSGIKGVGGCKVRCRGGEARCRTLCVTLKNILNNSSGDISCMPFPPLWNPAKGLTLALGDMEGRGREERREGKGGE